MVDTKIEKLDSTVRTSANQTAKNEPVVEVDNSLNQTAIEETKPEIKLDTKVSEDVVPVMSIDESKHKNATAEHTSENVSISAPKQIVDKVRSDIKESSNPSTKNDKDVEVDNRKEEKEEQSSSQDSNPTPTTELIPEACVKPTERIDISVPEKEIDSKTVESKSENVKPFVKVNESIIEEIKTVHSPSLTKEQEKKYDVIVIGAGLSGLSAARELAKHNLNILVLEARDRVGGRTHTMVEASTKLWVDLGGSYLGPTQDDVLEIVEKLNLETYCVNDAQETAYMRVCWDRKRDESYIERRRRFGNDCMEPAIGNLFHNIDFIHVWRLINEMCEEIPAETPWLAPNAYELDSITFAQFIEKEAKTKTVRGFFINCFLLLEVCTDANEVSLLWFLWYIKQCGGFDRLMCASNGSQERKIKGGSQQICEGLRKLLTEDHEGKGECSILTGKPVCQLKQTNDEVLVKTLDGQIYKSSKLICAIPPHLWLKIHYEPQLPARKNLLAQRSPMGMCMKVILYYDTPFWRDYNLNGSVIGDVSGCGKYPLIYTLDETKPDNSHPAIISFVNGPLLVANQMKNDKEIGDIVANTLVEATQLKEFANFKRVITANWTNEQYSGGCYPTTFGPLTLTKFGRFIREPFINVHYAGTETAIKWSGYMDGAVSAGKRAAREILFKVGILKDESLIWQNEPVSSITQSRPFDKPLYYKYGPSLASLACVVKSSLVAGSLVALAFVFQDDIYTQIADLTS